MLRLIARGRKGFGLSHCLLDSLQRQPDAPDLRYDVINDADCTTGPRCLLFTR
jgi:hypothetical protein